MAGVAVFLFTRLRTEQRAGARTALDLDSIHVGDYRFLALTRLAVSLAASAILALHVLVSRRRLPSRRRQGFDFTLVLLSTTAVAVHFNLGRFHSGTFFNHRDLVHSYLGAKYFPELGYYELYGCLAVADVEAGARREAQRRWTRDLRTNEATTGHEAIERPELCKARFTEARWADFSHDARWFRDRTSQATWDLIMMSHGYNASPVTTAIVYPFANLAPASALSVGLLVAIDFSVLGIMWLAVAWAFGWRIMCVGLIWWGTNLPASWMWLGGSVLRMLPLASLVVAVCLERTNRTFAAGASLGVAVVTRLYPAIILVGPLLGTILTACDNRAAASRRAALLMAGVLSSSFVLSGFSLLVPESATRASGRWRDFRDDVVTFSRTPVTNAEGLPAILWFEEASRVVHVGALWDRYPWDTWRAARGRVLAERRWLHGLLLVAYLVVLTIAVRGRDPWEAMVLGTGAIPIAIALPSYYYSFLLVFAFLGVRFPSISVLLLGLSAFTNLALALVDARDDLHALNSLGIVTFVVAATVILAVDTRRARRDAAGS